MADFQLTSPYKPMGDQPEAIRQLTEGVQTGEPAQVLLGVTGSGKTFTIANVIANIGKPTLILSHNKTLAAQLYTEMKGFFPNNAVEYYVSYYDYYQPEAYIASTDTYIEKDLAINDDIDKLRLAATSALLSGRKDVVVISSVSCIYGTLQENSVIKADYIHSRTGMDCFADDTGLEVDALGGAPGVHSARYATDGHDFDANIDKLLAELAKHPGEPRTARFRSVVTLVFKGEYHFFEGTLEGIIAPARRGTNGFGYDPVFIPYDYPDNTVAELDDETKNAISHRGKALRAMAEWLREAASTEAGAENA